MWSEPLIVRPCMGRDQIKLRVRLECTPHFLHKTTTSYTIILWVEEDINACEEAPKNLDFPKSPNGIWKFVGELFRAGIGMASDIMSPCVILVYSATTTTTHAGNGSEPTIYPIRILRQCSRSPIAANEKCLHSVAWLG